MVEKLPEAVRAALEILRISDLIAGNRHRRIPREDELAKVVQSFGRLQMRWCLIGAQAVSVYLRPRATADADFLVDDRHLPALLRELETEHGRLDTLDVGPAMRLRTLGVDLVRSSNHAVFLACLDHTVEHSGWKLPRREALLVLKFMSAISPWRGKDRARQDVVDLAALYRAVDPEDLDRGLLMRLAGQVHPGAEKELGELLGKLDRDEPLTI